VIPTTSLTPESAQRPKKTSWLSLQGWAPLFIDEEEIVARMTAAMSSRWCWQECAVGNLKRAGGGRRRRTTQGRGGGNVYARWQAADDMTRRGGQRGRGKASRKRTTQQEGRGVGRRKASGRGMTQQEGHRCGGRRWWNPPMQVSTDVDAIACQLPLHQEKEGRGPIVIEAREQFTTMTRTPRARTTASTMLSSWQRLQWGRKM
jgi:hypothetical protein